MYAKKLKTFQQFIIEDAQQFSSAETSINKNKLPEAYSTIHRKFGWQPDTLHLDIGGGKFDNAVDFLKTQGVRGLVFDPFNRSEEHNEGVMREVGKGGVHSASLFNVLNVIKEPEYRAEALRTAHQSLKPGGRVFISIYEGDKSGTGKQTKKDSWQNNMATAAYLEEVQRIFPNAKLQHGIIHGTKE
jgi:SAM-dependent methyltransferase